MGQKLTDKESAFVEEYLVDLNGTQAAIRAGYSEKSANRIASDKLSKLHIQEKLSEAMQKRSNRTEVTQDRVIQEYARIAFVDPRKFFDEEGKLIPLVDLDEDTARTVGGLDYYAEYETSQGSEQGQKEKMGSTTKIKLIDKKGALDSLGKHLGMFPNKNEHSGPDGGPIDFKWEVHIIKPKERD